MVGNLSNFSKIDVLRCFMLLDKNASRSELSKVLELGEGTVRTILDILKSKGLLDSTKKGHFLSGKGLATFMKIGSGVGRLRLVAFAKFYPELKKAALIVKNIENLRQVYKLRDVAVKSGADGALILKYNKKLTAAESDYDDFDEIENLFKLEENDVLIIAFSNKKRQAENGALSVAVELNAPLKKFAEEF